MAFHIPGPDAWSRKLRRVKGCGLGSDTCVINDEQFFVRGLIRVPVAGLEDAFEWGVWVSLTEEDIVRMAEVAGGLCPRRWERDWRSRWAAACRAAGASR